MVIFSIPAVSPAVDLNAWPGPLHTSEPGSFAHNTFKVRIPLILDDILDGNSFPPDIRSALLALRDEVVAGRIQALPEAAPDAAFWNAASMEHLGKTWLEVPWYWAETYLYRRVLEATRYFDASHAWHGIDPYAKKKRAEIAPHAAPKLVDQTLAGLPRDPNICFQHLCYASLWGNRTDLSYNVARHITPAASLEEERAHLLVDDTLPAWKHLADREEPADIALVTDNAGAELLLDLALADFLLCSGAARSVTLHVKPQPFFVSDAMPKDVLDSIEALSAAGAHACALSERLTDAVTSGRLGLRPHWFYATCLMYYQLPEDLRRELGRFDLSILKGDANYRRLLGDARWAPDTPFARIVAYFPTPLLALRTLKAELIAGLAPGEAERLFESDPAWRINGRRGVAQAWLG